MVQSRICSRYGSKCQHASSVPKSFLSLPANLRDEVYRYAGSLDNKAIRLRLCNGVLFFSYERYRMPSTTEFHLTFCRTRNGIPMLWAEGCGSSWPWNEDGVDGVEFYLTLRLVSRAINKDAVRYLCTNNIVLLEKVDLTEPFFKNLERAPFNLLQWVRRCTVIFSISGASLEKSEDEKWDLSLYETYSAVWLKFVSLLAGSADISKLEVNIACDIGDTNAAQLTIKALQDLRPAKCTLRLSDGRNRELEGLARSAVHSVTREGVDESGSFRFLDLPKELRQNVLRFTDLVIPSREVDWCPRLGFSVQYPYAERSTPCSHFCSTYYAVFPPCGCWKTPSRLFLVCRTMLDDARAIFFRSNRFIISPSDELLDPFSQRKAILVRREAPFEASSFLRDVVPRQALAHLRDLEILFSGTQYNFQSTQGTYLTEWEDTIQTIAPYLKRLTLRIYLGVSRSFYQPIPIETSDLQLSLARLCQAHAWIVRPLRQLRCVDGLFIRAWSPFDHGSFSEARVQRYFQQHEKRLEALVMGSTYNSRIYPKKDGHVRMWREVYREDAEQWPMHRAQSRIPPFIP